MKKLTFIFILFALSGCYKETQPAVNDVIVQLYAANSTIPADGATMLNITADLPGKTVSGSYNVAFLTTAGLFYDTQKSATTIASLQPAPDSSYRGATAILVAPALSGSINITATVGSINRTLTIQAVTAYPQSVKLLTNLQFVDSKPPSEATLTLNLVRSTGIATAGIKAQISATDNLGNPIGNFRNGNIALSDKTGNVTFYFSPNQTVYRGQVFLKAWLIDFPALSDSQTLTLIN